MRVIGGIYMEKTKKSARKTVNLDEELVRECMVLMESTGDQSFSEYVGKALRQYNTWVLTGKENTALTRQISAAIRNELRGIETRLSKGLYRYAVFLDVMGQVITACTGGFSEYEINRMYGAAKSRAAKTRGVVDLGVLTGVMDHEVDTEEND